MKTYKALVFDIETDGLDPSVVHMVAIGTPDGSKIKVYENIEQALNILSKAEMLIGHNIIGYDLPVLKKLQGWSYEGPLFDTMIASQLLYRDLYMEERKYHPEWLKVLPPRLVGSHSLEAWGFRLGELKKDFGKRTDWSFTKANRKEFLEYAKQDVKVTAKLYQFLKPGIEPYEEAFEMEQEIAKVIARQKAYGFLVDKEKAQELLGTIYTRLDTIEEELQTAFPPREVVLGTYKRPNSKRGIKAGDKKIKIVRFNPGSRDHIAKVLQDKYGWKPKEFSPTGKPVINEEVLAGLKYPEAKLIAEYLKLTKYQGMLSEGSQAILKHINKEDGRVHGSVNTLGAVSRRMTHSNPNVAQMPATHDFRELFTVPKGKTLVGIDASGLELRCLAHYLAPYDQGRYTHTILNGDIHTMNQKAAGLATRKQAKRFIYALIYGAGVGLIADIAGLKSAGAGAKLKQRFLKNTPGLEKLITRAQAKAKQQGYLKSIDGVLLPVRSEHKSLNLLLQSAGAIVMKRALVILDKDLQAQGLVPGIEYEFVANVHDEWQIEVFKDAAELVAKIGVEAIKKAGDYYGFRCPLDGEAKIGLNWAETH